MSIVVCIGLTVFIFALITLVATVIFVKQAGLRIMAVAGICALLIAGGAVCFSYQVINEHQEREKIAQEERALRREEEIAERNRKLAAEEAARKAAEEKAKKESEAKKAEDAKNGKDNDEKNFDKKTDRKAERVQIRKIREWNELGRALADVEVELSREVVEIDDQMKKVSLEYEQERISSYEELRQRATLGLRRQNLILKALQEKDELLKAAVLISDEEKKHDKELLEKRREKALEDKAKYEGMLQQVEENSGVFKTL